MWQLIICLFALRMLAWYLEDVTGAPNAPPAADEAGENIDPSATPKDPTTASFTTDHACFILIRRRNILFTNTTPSKLHEMTRSSRHKQGNDPDQTMQNASAPTRDPASLPALYGREIEYSKHSDTKAKRRDSATESHSLDVVEAPTAATVGFPVLTRACTCLRHRFDLYHQTIHFRELTNLNASKHTLRNFQHDALLLVQRAIGTFDGLVDFAFIPAKIEPGKPHPRGYALSPDQHKGMRMFKLWCKEKGAHFRRWKQRSDSFFDVPIEVFNQLFFLGQLPNRLNCAVGCHRLKIEGRSPPGTQRRGVTVTEVVGAKTQGRAKTTMWIDQTHPEHCWDGRALLNTILHELCHAFLQRHSCYNGGGEGCERSQVCVELCQENYGCTGHGRAWQMLAAAVEEAAGRLIGDVIKGGWRPDLGRFESAVKEISTVGGGAQVLREADTGDIKAFRAMAGGWWPSECDIEKLGGEAWWRLKPLLRSRDDDCYLVFRMVRRWALDQQGCIFRARLRNKAYAQRLWPVHATNWNASVPVFDSRKSGWANTV